MRFRSPLLDHDAFMHHTMHVLDTPARGNLNCRALHRCRDQDIRARRKGIYHRRIPHQMTTRTPWNHCQAFCCPYIVDLEVLWLMESLPLKETGVGCV